MIEYIDELKKIIEDSNGTEISELDINEQELISFYLMINGKKLNLALFHRKFEEREQIMLQVFATFPAIYDQPESDFYRILEKINLNSVIGHIFFSQENDNFHISYKSNYICSIRTRDSLENFKIFLDSSILMITDFDNELNVM
jgi:hypothetical protein